MQEPQFHLPFFANLLLLLVAARILGEIMERLKQPAMIGEILAGILLGPSVFNLIHRTEDIKVVSELGIFLLVILAGMEIHVDEILRSFKGKNIIISLLAFFLPIISGYLVGSAFQENYMTSIFIGLCVAITALPVSIRMLMDIGKIHSSVGRKIISVAVFDDVLALTILGILLNVKDTDMTFHSMVNASGYAILKLVIFIALLAGAYWLIKKTLRKDSYLEELLDRWIPSLRGKEPLFALFLIFVLLFSTFTESLGLHFIVGAFFASMLVDEKLIGKINHQTIVKTTSTMSMGFLAPIFFAGIGLELSLSSIQQIGLLIAVISVSFLSKIAGGFIGGILAGYPARFSYTIGVGLNARGIMELVIANIAYKSGLIDIEIFSILVIMGVFTTITTPFILKKAFGKSP